MGPATGGATTGAQGDLQFLRWGTSGGYPVIVLAPVDAASCYWLTQRVIWDGSWKLVFNGFDFDELYNLDDDPYELKNLANDPQYEPEIKRLMAYAWKVIEETGDAPLANSMYYSLRLAPYGPEG